MSKQSLISQLRDELEFRSGGKLQVNLPVKNELKHLATNTIHNYLQLPLGVQLAVQWSYSIQGKYGTKVGQKGGYVFQMSHGTQQIKEYNPESYKTNSENTPLRKRARLIMQEAMQHPQEGRKELIRELYRNTPYHLKQDEAINLRMKNFYFDREVVKDDELIIYRAVDPNNLNPSTDTIITEKKYGPKREIVFAYEGRAEEYYYAVNRRTGEMSNTLHFIWEVEFDPVIRQRVKQEEAQGCEVKKGLTQISEIPQIKKIIKIEDEMSGDLTGKRLTSGTYG
ncbi:MAG: hypothetical protein WC327_07170 [Candidatus Cloacimonadia bacterium]